MSIDTGKPLTQEEADSRQMIEHAFKGKSLDPEVARRVHEGGEKLRQEMRAAGVKIDAAELVRQSRQEL